MENGSRNRQSGFTLVELLVVIAIIAILAAILMPTLERARINSRRIVGASNYRQMAQGFLLYSMDNEGTLPPGHWNWPGCGVQHFWCYHSKASSYVRRYNLITPAVQYDFIKATNIPVTGAPTWDTPGNGSVGAEVAELAREGVAMQDWGALPSGEQVFCANYYYAGFVNWQAGWRGAPLEVHKAKSSDVLIKDRAFKEGYLSPQYDHRVVQVQGPAAPPSPGWHCFSVYSAPWDSFLGAYAAFYDGSVRFVRREDMVEKVWWHGVEYIAYEIGQSY